MKKALSLILALTLLFALTVPALAVDYAPLTVENHRWKAYGDYSGIFTFSAAKVEQVKTEDTPGQHTEERTVWLQPGSTVTVKDDGRGMNPPSYAAVTEGLLLSGTQCYLALRAGTFTVEEMFCQHEAEAYQFNGPAEPIGPFASFVLKTETMDENGKVTQLLYTVTIDASAPAGPKVVLSPQNLMVDGVMKDVEKYNIDGSNYFKLRDIAYLLNGTGSQFSVGWDAETGTVSIVTGEAYTPNGSEMLVGADKSATAVPSSQTIKINGAVRADLSVYNLDGNNFFKLRDLGEALGFDVDYDAATNTAIVKSK